MTAENHYDIGGTLAEIFTPDLDKFTQALSGVQENSLREAFEEPDLDKLAEALRNEGEQ